eukprot:216547-Rhodomonas_salina.1
MRRTIPVGSACVGRHCRSVWLYRLRASYAMSGTHVAYAATRRRCPLALANSPISRYPPPQKKKKRPTRPCAMSGTDIGDSAVSLRLSTGLSGTDLGHAVVFLRVHRTAYGDVRY